jgi:competence protein ComEA
VGHLQRTLVIVVAELCLLGSVPAQRAEPMRTGPMTPAPEERVDINHATVEALMKVPGMTRVWAGRIVRFRPYRAKNDLLDRGVVSNDVYGRIKVYIIAHRDKQ